jgi:NAD(P)H-dependent FMN reductase
MHIEVITGTTREGRFSEKVAAWVLEVLGARDDFDVESVDLRDHPLPWFEGISPIRRGREYPTEAVARFGETVDRADGFVILTAEYNHGYPAVLKNAMDWTFPEWNRKPVSFVGWGNVGGARAVEQLRQVAVEFEMAPLRHAVHILPDVLIPILREGADPATALAALTPRLDLLADDLAWWTAALAAARVPA